MRRFINYIIASALCIFFLQCEDYLETSSPSNADNDFVTSTTSETFKTLSWCYANYRQGCIMGTYRWNDPIGSDAEMYPEENSSNNINATLKIQDIPVDAVNSGFNNLYSTLARATKIAEIIEAKTAYQADISSGKASDWTQLYGEAVTIRALCYFELIKHFGDVPFGYENAYVEDYTLTSRFDIYDNLIALLKEVEPLMYKIGESDITAERFSRTFCNALIGQIALYAGGYQTIRTDINGLYGNVQFTTKGKEEYNCIYARRTDYIDYYTIANQYFQAAIDNAGTVNLITADDRSYTNNPFQRHFQYFADREVSSESLFELGNIQGGQNRTTSEYPYAFGRPSDGGSSNAAPCKTFCCLRIIPTVYYGDFEEGDKRRDASVAVTGSAGDGNEKILSFKPGNKTSGGISTNKWDENRMNPPYVAKNRSSGMNWPVLRMADVLLMLAEVKAELGDEGQAISLVNQIRERAFGNSSHNISGLSGEELKEAILQERKLELLGEGTRRWDLIRSGKLSERAVAIRQELNLMISELQSNGYYQFSNGNVISNYIMTKNVSLENPLTYECTDNTNPALYPGWRGQYDYSTLEAVSSKVTGTEHNLAIEGLFSYIDTTSSQAIALKNDGYTVTDWAINIVENASSYNNNILSGVTSADQPPRYYWPIPSETISKSNGKVTNGYGLPQQ